MMTALREGFRAMTPVPMGAAKMACGSKEFELPLSRFPLRGQAGAGRVPPTPEARCAPAKSAGTPRCCRLPPQEGCRPLVDPPLSSLPGHGGLRDNRNRPNGLPRRHAYTNLLTTPPARPSRSSIQPSVRIRPPLALAARLSRSLESFSEMMWNFRTIRRPLAVPWLRAARHISIW
jgi:hypothetical protein